VMVGGRNSSYACLVVCHFVLFCYTNPRFRLFLLVFSCLVSPLVISFLVVCVCMDDRTPILLTLGWLFQAGLWRRFIERVEEDLFSGSFLSGT